MEEVQLKSWAVGVLVASGWGMLIEDLVLCFCQFYLLPISVSNKESVTK